MLGPGLRRDRPIDAPVAVAGESLGRGRGLDQLGQFRVSLDDLLGDLEDLGGLLSVIRRRVDLSVLNRLRPDQMDQNQGCDQRSLAVLPSDRQDRPTNPAATVQAVRLVDVADKPLLPGPQFERTARTLARGDGQVFYECNDPVCPSRPANLLLGWSSASAPLIDARSAGVRYSLPA